MWHKFNQQQPVIPSMKEIENSNQNGTSLFNSAPLIPTPNLIYILDWQPEAENSETLRSPFDSYKVVPQFYTSFTFEESSAIEKLKSDFSISQREFNEKLDNLKEESMKKLENTEKEFQKYQQSAKNQISNLKTTVFRLTNLILRKNVENERKFKTSVKFDKDWKKTFFFPHDIENPVEIDLTESLRSCIHVDGLSAKEGCREYLRHVVLQCIPDFDYRINAKISKKDKFTFPQNFLDSITEICFVACGGNLEKNYQNPTTTKLSKNERLFSGIRLNVNAAGKFLLSADKKTNAASTSTKIPKKGILKKSFTEFSES